MRGGGERFLSRNDGQGRDQSRPTFWRGTGGAFTPAVSMPCKVLDSSVPPMRMLMKPLGAAVAWEVRGLGGNAAAMAAATSLGTVGPAKLRSDLSHCGCVRERVRGVEEWVRRVRLLAGARVER